MVFVYKTLYEYIATKLVTRAKLVCGGHVQQTIEVLHKLVAH